jgi:hypothetical protein
MCATVPSPWVARAGVVARARVTIGFRDFFAGRFPFLAADLLGFARCPALALMRFLDVFRADFDFVLRTAARALPLAFLRDFAAFNCFPLLGLVALMTAAALDSHAAHFQHSS